MTGWPASAPGRGQGMRTGSDRNQTGRVAAAAATAVAAASGPTSARPHDLAVTNIRTRAGPPPVGVATKRSSRASHPGMRAVVDSSE